MKERPVIMSAESVRAILAGRKTQTRRVIKPQPLEDVNSQGWYPWCWGEDRRRGNAVAGMRDHASFCEALAKCAPLGHVGDRLWVKEAHRYWHHKGYEGGWVGDDDVFYFDRESVRYEENLRIGRELRHDSDGWCGRVTYLDDSTPITERELAPWKKRSPLYMPRWASRITLEITDVRVERVQEISVEDAVAEGCPMVKMGPAWLPVWRARASAGVECADPGLVALEWYRAEWHALNARRGFPWEDNPWVLAYGFRVEDSA